MGTDPFAFQQMAERNERNKKRKFGQDIDARIDRANTAAHQEASERETGKGGLHEQIQAYCRSQWPRWLVIAARTDLPSTLPVGCQDLTCFLPGGRVVCIELKSRIGKMSAAQRDWAHEMKRIGHEVFIVKSFADFLSVVQPPKL